MADTGVFAHMIYSDTSIVGDSAMARNLHSEAERTTMSFAIYILGFLILIGGLIYGAVILHVAAHWIAVGAIVLLGLAILKGVQATRGKDPSQ